MNQASHMHTPHLFFYSPPQRLQPPASPGTKPSMAACEATLNTCEILEHIIAFLPHDSILRAERVCKTWKTLVESSTKIAQA